MRLLLAGAVLCLAFAALVHVFHLSDTVDRIALDTQFKLLRAYHPQPVPNDVVVIGIDEATYAAFREPLALWHPHLGALFTALATAKPAVVGLDVTLPDRSYHFLIPNYDQSLLMGMKSLKAQCPILLGRTVDGDGNPRKIFAPFVSVSGADSLASVMYSPDGDDVVRHFEESLGDANIPVKTMAGKMAALQGSGDRQWKGLIDYSVGDAFSYIPFIDVLSWYENKEFAKLQNAFSGKPVLIGVIMPYTDRILFPVPLASWQPEMTKLPGVLLHAQAYRSMQMHGLIQEIPRVYVLVLTLVGALFWLGRVGLIKVVLLFLFVAGLLALSTLQLWQTRYLPAGAALFSCLFAFIFRAIYEALLQINEKRLLKGTFGSYVSPQILKEIMAGNIKPGLGGERKRLCVLFADIRDFTTRSEKHTPEEVISLLNGYFTEMTAAIHKHDGTVDKFIGDGIMAFFGAPKVLECAERNALEAAQEMLVRLHEYNEIHVKHGQEPVRIGIGLHTGDVIVGHVGSELRNEYTAIGDVVNAASRLEGITKTLGYQIVCSRAVAEAVGASAGMVDLGMQSIKGHTDMHVYGWNPPLIAAIENTQCDKSAEPVVV